MMITINIIITIIAIFIFYMYTYMKCTKIFLDNLVMN
jgi:hypothetical protein